MTELPAIHFVHGPQAGRLLGWCRRLGVTFAGPAAGEPDAEAAEPGAGRRPQHPVDRGARARLKRCALPGDAFLEPAFQSFLDAVLPDEAELRAVLDDQRTIAGLARVAILIPHVRTVDRRQRLSEQLAHAVPLAAAESGLRTPLRLNALIRQPDPDEAVRNWRRLLPLFEGVNACDLAQLAFDWSEKRRREFAFHYFAAASRANRAA